MTLFDLLYFCLCRAVLICVQAVWFFFFKLQFIVLILVGFDLISFRVPTPPGKSRNCVCKIPGPGMSRKMSLVLESTGSLSAQTWKVVEFARQWCRHRMQWCGCRRRNCKKCSNSFCAIRNMWQWWTLLAYDRVHEKCFWSPGKVLDFFVTKRVGTLFFSGWVVYSQFTFVVLLLLACCVDALWFAAVLQCS